MINNIEEFNNIYGYSKEDKLQDDDLLIRTARQDGWDEAHNAIRSLVQRYPNDQELGEKLRELFTKNIN